jgi:lipopolysaccharide export system protein LptA
VPSIIIKNISNMKILIIIILTTFSIGYASQAKTPTIISQNIQIQADTTAMVEFKGNYKFKENPMVQQVTVRIEKDKLVADPWRWKCL